MKKETDIDALISATVKKEGLDTPGRGFTTKVMGGLLKETDKVKAYKPLLPEKFLAGICAFAVLIVAFLILVPDDYSQTLFGTFFLERITGYLGALSFHIEWPANISYIIISASLLIMIQLILFGRICRKIYR